MKRGSRDLCRQCRTCGLMGSKGKVGPEGPMGPEGFTGVQGIAGQSAPATLPSTCTFLWRIQKCINPNYTNTTTDANYPVSFDEITINSYTPTFNYTDPDFIILQNGTYEILFSTSVNYASKFYVRLNGSPAPMNTVYGTTEGANVPYGQNYFLHTILTLHENDVINLMYLVNNGTVQGDPFSETPITNLLILQLNSTIPDLV